MIACHIQEYFVLENIQVYWSSSRKWTQVSDLSMINVRDFFSVYFVHSFSRHCEHLCHSVCSTYYGIDFCTFPQVLVLLLQCEKNMEAKYPSCQANSLPVPSPLPAPPQFFSKNKVFSQSESLSKWQMKTICFASNFSFIQIQQLISVYVYDKVTVFSDQYLKEYTLSILDVAAALLSYVEMFDID